VNEKQTCQTCAHLVLNGGGFYKGHPHCGHDYGPKSGQLVARDATTCANHQTETEKQASNIVYTSIDCAKSGIERASVEVLHMAKQLEIAGANRTGIIKKIETRLKRLEGGQPCNRTA
jgi:hypothetical protein